ncbi:DNA-directed RNA polymerase V subunit 5A-like protein [Drosera capensis]
MEIDGVEGGDGGGEITAPAAPCLGSFIDEGPVESRRYYLARRTALEMLRDRGYDVSESEMELSLPEFRDRFGGKPEPERLRVSCSLRSDAKKKGLGLMFGEAMCRGFEKISLIMNGEKNLLRVYNAMLVVFSGPSALKVSAIRAIFGQIANKESYNGLILVLQSHITNQAQKAVELFSMKVEIFQITDLLVNITKHVLKPKHRVLTEQEKKKLLKKYSLEEKQLPKMSHKDAIAKYYGLEKGQVVKVMYSGEITQSHVTYRCVW